MGDLIDRQAAIDTLDVGAEFLRRVLDEVDIVGVERAKYEWGLGLIESYISDMKELPSAQTEHATCYLDSPCEYQNNNITLPSAQPERQINLDGFETPIEILSALRSQFNCFDEQEEKAYYALSVAIHALSAQSDTDEWCTECKEYDKEHHSCPRWNRVIKTTLVDAQEWILCSERLPEEYGEYLITWETSKAPTRFIGFAEGEETGVWDDQHDRFVFSWLPEDYIIEQYPDWRVIAWMPLPEPYKGEQE